MLLITLFIPKVIEVKVLFGERSIYCITEVGDVNFAEFQLFEGSFYLTCPFDAWVIRINEILDGFA